MTTTNPAPTLVYASIGEISSGTMRTEDLLDTFADELEDLVQRNAAAWCSDAGRAERDRYVTLIGDAREIEDFDSEEASEIVDELSDALGEFAPPYCWFGANENDGASYGFWPCLDADEFDGLKVDDTSEVPDDYEGEVLHVNDHGNMTLYSASAGELTEIWSVV